MRNLAVDRGKAAARRGARERVAGRERNEGGADGADVVERAEVHRRVTTAVMSLEEPFRTAVLLRYYDGLTPAEIGARLGVPAATVRSRLTRGLDRLRGRLREIDPAGWHAALLPLAARVAPAPAAPIPSSDPLQTSHLLLGGAVVATKKKLVIAGVVLLLLLGGWGVAQWGGVPDPGGAASDATDTSAAAAERRRVERDGRPRSPHRT